MANPQGSGMRFEIGAAEARNHPVGAPMGRPPGVFGFAFPTGNSLPSRAGLITVGKLADCTGQFAALKGWLRIVALAADYSRLFVHAYARHPLTAAASDYGGAKKP